MNRPDGIDKAVVKNITTFGGDLEKERGVEFFLYFPTEYDAVMVEVEFINLRFYTEVHFRDHLDEWFLYANKVMQVSTERLIDIGNWMEQLAEKHKGRYDGWGTLI